MYRDEHEKKTLRFTLDGRTITTDDHRMSAAEILGLGGLDPATFDLAELRGCDRPHKFADTDQVHIKNGDQFVSVRQSAPVG